MFVAGNVAAIHHVSMAPTVSCSPCDPFPRTGTGVTAGGLSGLVGAHPDSIDAAWAEVEAAAHPEALIRAGRTGMTRTGWATCYLHGEHVAVEFAPSLAEALRKLAATLRANHTDPVDSSLPAGSA